MAFMFNVSSITQSVVSWLKNASLPATVQPAPYMVTYCYYRTDFA